MTALGKNLSSGSVVQVVNVMDGEVATGSTRMFNDDTIPVNTEGDEWMTLAITPRNVNNLLKIDVVFNFAQTAANQRHIIALFQDSTSAALAGAMEIVALDDANAPKVVCFTHFMTAGTVVATTFKVRSGAQTSGTTTFNGNSGTRRLGGAMASSITVTEIKA